MNAENLLTLAKPLSLADQGQDDSLLEGCRAGSVSAYETLYRQHGNRMKSVAMLMLGNQSDAEDAVQETFLKLFRTIGGFTGQCSLATWIFKILVNTCRDEGRRRARVKAGEAQMEPPAPLQPGVTLKLALENALGRLQEQHRTVFLLFEVEGLRHTEIASILEVPEGTSRSWLFEAKQELKRLLMERKA